MSPMRPANAGRGVDSLAADELTQDDLTLRRQGVTDPQSAAGGLGGGLGGTGTRPATLLRSRPKDGDTELTTMQHPTPSGP